MPKQHTVAPGDCLSSIAYTAGFYPETIWNAAENAELRAQRERGTILAPGDVLYVPDKRPKSESVNTGAIHPFRRRGVPSKLHLQVLDDGKPVANRPYVVSVDGAVRSGNTDIDGRIRVSIPPNAKKAKVRVGEGADLIQYELNLGHLRPIDDIAGVQARLEALGYDCGGEDGLVGDRTREALRGFQRKHSLPESGEMDETTRAKLREVFGS